MGYALNKAFPSTVKVDGGSGYRATANSGTGAEVTGPTIDRMPAGSSEGYDSAIIVHAGTATLDGDETLSIRTRIQESHNDSDWDAEEEIEAATVVLTAPSGGSYTDEPWDRKITLQLAGRKRYVRLLATPIGSRAGTDAMEGGFVAILGGAHELPVT